MNQEAVCVTCGKVIVRNSAVGWLLRDGANSNTPDHFCRPAPVVPSDDERCAFPNSQWGVCGIPESAHADLMQPLAGSRFHHEFQRPAPPTPSQDAEGDGLADEDREWMDAPMGPPRHQTIASQLGAIYDVALIQARAAAYGCGYALAVHGSEMRDLDLIAVPWTDEATDAKTLVEAIVRMTGGRHGQHPDSKRPHGRRSWSIHLNNEHALGNFKSVLPYIDLSVMPVESAIRAPYEELVKAARDTIEELDTLLSRYGGCLCGAVQTTTEIRRDRLKAALESLGGRS